MSNLMLEAALLYIAQGFKVFPVKPDKKPLTKHGLKDATQTKQGCREYWGKHPDAGIGLLTDGLVVLDFDVKNGGAESKKAIEAKYGILTRTRTHRTGGGGLHYIYRNPNGHDIRSKVAIGGYSGVDLRANGGYIVAPPSLHESGKHYEVIDDTEVVPAPSWVLELTVKKSPPTQATLEGMPIAEGERNTTLTSLAGVMRRKGMGEASIIAALLAENAARCQPPLPENEVINIAKSIIRYQPTPIDEPDIFFDEPQSQKKDNDNGTNKYPLLNNSLSTEPTNSERNKSVTENVTNSQKRKIEKLPIERENQKSVTNPLAERIEEWVKDTNSWFSYADIDKEFNIHGDNDKSNRRMIIKRLHEAGKLEPHPKDNKLYRYVNVNVRLIDFKSANLHKPIAIKYPFGIEYYFNTYPGNIIVVAGSPDAGKTAFLLNLIKLNQNDFSIFYQSSEMGESELQNRLMNFEDMELQDWNFTAEERSSNFADVIRPDCINIIDYLELCGDFYMIAEYLKQIHDKLNDGIAIVALQKDPKARQGRGGTFGLEKPRLYLNMDAGKVQIRKAKNWTHPEQNPNGLALNYKIIGGCKFVITENWHKDEK